MSGPAPDAEAQARARFVLLTLIRFGGVAIALVGVTVIGKRLIEPAELVGGLLVLLGVIEVTVVPALVARAWKGRADR